MKQVQNQHNESKALSLSLSLPVDVAPLTLEFLGPDWSISYLLLAKRSSLHSALGHDLFDAPSTAHSAIPPLHRLFPSCFFSITLAFSGWSL